MGKSKRGLGGLSRLARGFESGSDDYELVNPKRKVMM